jgi:cytochrome b
MQKSDITRDDDPTFVWDLPVRIFHWLLALLILLSWYTVEVSNNMNIHMLSGYTILSLVSFRIIWGFVGPRYARFASMEYRPRDIWLYARTFFTREPSRSAGHTPLGGVSVLAMLVVVSVQATTGLFATDEDFYAGPLNEYVSNSTGRALTEVHEVNFNILLGLICLHIAAVFYYLYFKRENLITAMFTGKKALGPAGGPSAEGSKLALAVGLMAAIAAAVYLMVNLL